MQILKQDELQIAGVVKSEINSIGMLKVGDVVGGVILEKESKRITVDLGIYGTGAIYGGEIQNTKEVVRNLKLGDSISGKVIAIDNEEGFVELSISEADKQKSWELVQELRDEEEIVKVSITGYNKGGLTSELKGLPAFLPASQLIQRGDEEMSNIDALLGKLVGEELDVRVIDVNPRARKLILSERAANELSTKELAKNYETGQIVEGVVSGVADFGVFVRFTDNPAVEGLIHISELGYRIIDNPKEVVKIDDPVSVKIIDIKDGKISLSLKALKPDPWIGIDKKFKLGDEIKGTVYTFHPYGAIVNIRNEEVQGHVHVTEFGSVEEMKKRLTLGGEYSFMVENVDQEEKRILLKMKNTQL